MEVVGRHRAPLARNHCLKHLNFISVLEMLGIEPETFHMLGMCCAIQLQLLLLMCRHAEHLWGEGFSHGSFELIGPTACIFKFHCPWLSCINLYGLGFFLVAADNNLFLKFS